MAISTLTLRPQQAPLPILLPLRARRSGCRRRRSTRCQLPQTGLSAVEGGAAEQAGAVGGGVVIVASGALVLGESFVAVVVVGEELVDAVEVLVEVVGRGGDGAGVKGGAGVRVGGGGGVVG